MPDNRECLGSLEETRDLISRHRQKDRTRTFQLLEIVGFHGQSEIRDLDIEIVVEENVLRFQISVDDVLRVDESDGFEYLAHDDAGALLRQRHSRVQMVE